jgi:hypothetical protein
MTDLERKLAEALGEQAGEVTLDLDAAWAEQQRRQLRPPRGRRVAVWVAPLAAVLMVLTSVLLPTQLKTAPTPPASQGEPLSLPKPKYGEIGSFGLHGLPITEFAGPADRWLAYAVVGSAADAVKFCLLATPAPAGTSISAEDGAKSPACVSISAAVVRSGYVGVTDGPLPADKAVYLVDPTVRELWLFDAHGGRSQARAVGMLESDRVFLATVHPGSPPVRFQVS